MTHIDPCARVEGTTVQIADLILIGQTLLNLAVATDQMRHASPAGTINYAEPLPCLSQEVVVDFTAWAGEVAGFEVGRDRLRRFLIDSGWRNRVLGFDAGPLTSDEATAARESA